MQQVVASQEQGKELDKGKVVQMQYTLHLRGRPLDHCHQDDRGERTNAPTLPDRLLVGVLPLDYPIQAQSAHRWTRLLSMQEECRDWEQQQT